MESLPATPHSNRLAEIRDELRLVLSGRASVVDAIIPAAAFLVFNALFEFSTAVWLSLGLTFGFTVYRFLKKEPLTFILLGLAGASLTAILSQLGGTEGYILPGLITNGLTIFIILVSLLVRRPMVAWTSHFVRGWPRDWYWHPRVRPAYSEVTLAWLVFFALRTLFDLYLAASQNGVLLSVGKFLEGWPATIVLLVVSYLYGIWRLRRLRGPSVEEFTAQLPPPWQSQARGF